MAAMATPAAQPIAPNAPPNSMISRPVAYAPPIATAWNIRAGIMTRDSVDLRPLDVVPITSDRLTCRDHSLITNISLERIVDHTPRQPLCGQHEERGAAPVKERCRHVHRGRHQVRASRASGHSRVIFQPANCESRQSEIKIAGLKQPVDRLHCAQWPQIEYDSSTPSGSAPWPASSTPSTLRISQ